jgi:hypothetical protein
VYLFDLIQAIVRFGLPVAGLSFLLFTRLYSSGRLDRNADHKAIRSSLQNIKKAAKDKATRDRDFFQTKWMKFGGGFYGVAGLWTFFVIEATDLFSFVWNFPGFADLFKDGLISFIVNALANQLINFISAMIWFTYWPTAERNLLVWIATAYLGYLLGIKLARSGFTTRLSRLRE